MKLTTDLALLLGMFCGDGSLPIKCNGQGYPNYPINFFNTNRGYVELFKELFLSVFGVNGKIYCACRKNRKPLWRFEKYSRALYFKINEDFEIPNGKKACAVFIPSFIVTSNMEIKKYFFLGLLMTDGGVRQSGRIIFNSASEQLIHELSTLIKELWNFDTKVKYYLQNGRFNSYQINLKKAESQYILADLPVSRNSVSRSFIVERL